MKKYIKYLISFLLIFGLTVNDSYIPSKVNSDSYHQVSYLDTRKRFNSKNSISYVSSRVSFSIKEIIKLISYSNLQNVYSTKVLTILKLRLELYQKINSRILQHVFLNKIITSKDQYSGLYIA